MTLSQESLEKTSGIQRLEEAATELYKALQAGRDTGKTTVVYASVYILNIDSTIRNGCHHGKARRISNAQFAVL